MDHVISKPTVMGGVPCFAGTRVPAAYLFEHLRGGYTVDYFLDQFPSVKREQVDAVLQLAQEQIPADALRKAG